MKRLAIIIPILTLLIAGCSGGSAIDVGEVIDTPTPTNEFPIPGLGGGEIPDDIIGEPDDGGETDGGTKAPNDNTADNDVAISITEIKDAFFDRPYELKLEATGGSGSYVWSASNLPNGLEVDGDTISGTPTELGRTRVSISAVDADDFDNKDSTRIYITVVDTAIKFKILSDSEKEMGMSDNYALETEYTLGINRVYRISAGAESETGYKWSIQSSWTRDFPSFCDEKFDVNNECAGESELDKITSSDIFILMTKPNAITMDAKNNFEKTGRVLIVSEGPIWDEPETKNPAPTSKLEEKSYTTWAGGNGGDEATIKCGDGEVISQMIVNSGSVLDRIIIFCRDIDSTIEDDWKNPALIKGVVGGDGGGSHIVQPPSGFALTGWITRTSKGKIGEFMPIAKRIHTFGVDDASGWNNGKFGRKGGDREYNLCPAGEVLTGIKARHGKYVDGIQGICSEVIPVASKEHSVHLGESKTTSLGGTVNGIHTTTDEDGDEFPYCKQDCSSGKAVIGFTHYIGKRSKNRKVIRGLGLICGSLNYEENFPLQGVMDDHGAWSNRDVEILDACGQNTPDVSISRVPGSFATGFHGLIGAERLYGFGLLTSPFQLLDADIDITSDELDREEELYIAGAIRLPDNKWYVGVDGQDFGTRRCPSGQVLTGITFRDGADVDGIKDYTCTEVSHQY